MVEIRVSEFRVVVVKYLGTTPVIIYEATEPAEVYTLPATLQDKTPKEVR